MEKHSVENEKSIGAERKIVRLRTENHLAQIDFMGCGGCPMIFFKGLLLIHFERVSCTVQVEVLYLSWG